MNRMFALVALTTLIVGCKGENKGDGSTAKECTNLISENFPLAGESAAFYRTTIEATVLETDPAITITVDGPGGGVNGTSEWVDNTLVFTPGDTLEPKSDYTVTIGGRANCDDAEVGFKTSEVGANTNANDLVGKTFALDLANGRFVEPPGIGSLISSYLDIDILIGITSAGNTLAMSGALGAVGSDPPEQDFCVQSIEFPSEADFSENPFFQIGPADTVLDVEGFTIELGDLVISGAFGPQGDYIAGAVLAGDIDVRQDILGELLGDGSTGADACSFIAAVGIECKPCASDNKPFCLSLYVDSISAEEVPGSLVLLAADQTENHLCGDTCTNTDGGSDVDDDGDSITNSAEAECDDSSWP